MAEPNRIARDLHRADTYGYFTYILYIYVSGEMNWMAGAKRTFQIEPVTLVSIKRPNEFRYDLCQQKP